jgi:MSHA biogenesis protein MshJ
VTPLATLARKVGTAAERLDALSLRERALIFGAAFTLAYLSWQSFLMRPLTARASGAEQRLTAARQHMAAIEQAASTAIVDPVLGAAARNQALKGRLSGLDAELRSAAQGYVAPERMTDLLRAILATQRGLKLVSLTNLPVESLSPKAVTPAGIDATDRGPFLHPVELVVEGDYVSVVAYLRALEVMPWKIHWRQLELVAGDYPVNRVHILIGVLSLSSEWMSV